MTKSARRRLERLEAATGDDDIDPQFRTILEQAAADAGIEPDEWYWRDATRALRYVQGLSQRDSDTLFNAMARARADPDFQPSPEERRLLRAWCAATNDVPDPAWHLDPPPVLRRSRRDRDEEAALLAEFNASA